MEASLFAITDMERIFTPRSWLGTPVGNPFFLSEDNLDSRIAQLIAYLCEGPRDQELGRTGHRNQCIILCRDDSESTQKFY